MQIRLLLLFSCHAVRPPPIPPSKPPSSIGQCHAPLMSVRHRQPQSEVSPYQIKGNSSRRRIEPPEYQGKNQRFQLSFPTTPSIRIRDPYPKTVLRVLSPSLLSFSHPSFKARPTQWSCVYGGGLMVVSRALIKGVHREDGRAVVAV